MLVSVIIPCFNSGKTITRTVKSIQSQSFTFFEIIIVNDGSDDVETIDILNNLDNIKLINQNNKGLPAARNKGIKSSKGELLFFVDADDWLDKDTLLHLTKTFENNNFSYVYPSLKLEGKKNLDYSYNFNFFTQLFFNKIPYSILIPKKTIESVGCYDEKMMEGYEDWELNIRLGDNSFFGGLCSDSILHYFVSPSGMLMSRSLKRHGYIYEYITNKHKKVYEPKRLKKIKNKWKDINLYMKYKCFIYYSLSKKLSNKNFTRIYLSFKNF